MSYNYNPFGDNIFSYPNLNAYGENDNACDYLPISLCNRPARIIPFTDSSLPYRTLTPNQRPAPRQRSRYYNKNPNLFDIFYKDEPKYEEPSDYFNLVNLINNEYKFKKHIRQNESADNITLEFVKEFNPRLVKLNFKDEFDNKFNDWRIKLSKDIGLNYNFRNNNDNDNNSIYDLTITSEEDDIEKHYKLDNNSFNVDGIKWKIINTSNSTKLMLIIPKRSDEKPNQKKVVNEKKLANEIQNKINKAQQQWINYLQTQSENELKSKFNQHTKEDHDQVKNTNSNTAATTTTATNNDNSDNIIRIPINFIEESSKPVDVNVSNTKDSISQDEKVVDSEIEPATESKLEPEIKVNKSVEIDSSAKQSTIKQYTIKQSTRVTENDNEMEVDSDYENVSKDELNNENKKTPEDSNNVIECSRPNDKTEKLFQHDNDSNTSVDSNASKKSPLLQDVDVDFEEF
ncbi:uncharacterized protein ASCRUDRAFT_75483 [Ascoidea rubescens DSM 1968]|uniref:Uncharacterized protein n=1 Tax=Ascoidea rubescens DSM 1968 TaxID=1344418 RepID=A0A1D2VIX2_9ASCO|nr:hypothetical protein ASCRUDRAFT_75483 [Ascoidea rubescens DSM 1968]ODV61473.1 hypothetical protein ASCRUDRAFT_75483 [Ascoidea rubescens DSM 1968]